MTFEHRLLVGFDEIKAVVFECNVCKTRTSIPVAEFNSPPLLCPKQHKWTTNKPEIEKSAAFGALALLINCLRDPMNAIYEQAGFHIFLEFEEPKREK